MECSRFKVEFNVPYLFSEANFCIINFWSYFRHFLSNFVHEFCTWTSFYIYAIMKSKYVRKKYKWLFPPTHLTVFQHKLSSILGQSTITSILGHSHADMCGQGIGALEMRNIAMFNYFFDKTPNFVIFFTKIADIFCRENF